MRATAFAHGGDILNRPGFVIHVHDGNERCVVFQRCLERVQIDTAVALNCQPRDPHALFFQPVERIEGGAVLGHHAHDMRAGADKAGHTLEREVDRLGGPRRPDQISGLRIDQPRHFFGRGIDQSRRRAARAVWRGRIGVGRHQRLLHGFDHARRQRAGGGIIEIDCGIRGAHPSTDALIRPGMAPPPSDKRPSASRNC